MIARSEARTVDVFLRDLDPHNSGLNRKRVVVPRKNVGLWQEFTLFRS